jgi:N utilization substance protein A
MASAASATRDREGRNAGGVLGEYGLNEEQGNEIIMAARAHWFDDEPAGEGPASEEAADADTSQ